MLVFDNSNIYCPDKKQLMSIYETCAGALREHAKLFGEGGSFVN
jgi:hypothetical protein